MASIASSIRAKKPAKAKKADHNGSLRAAIDLSCEECCGGSLSEVSRCTRYECFFWVVRPGDGPTQRPAGVVPTEAEYDAAIEARTSDAQREARAQNAERLRKYRDDEADEEVE